MGSMAECCFICCPPPGAAVIAPVGRPGRLRKIIKYIVWTEMVAAALEMVVFDPEQGFMSAIMIWIAYHAWASMHFLQVMIALICVSVDLFFDIYGYSSSDSLKMMVNSTTFS